MITSSYVKTIWLFKLYLSTMYKLVTFELCNCTMSRVCASVWMWIVVGFGVKAWLFFMYTHLFSIIFVSHKVW